MILGQDENRNIISYAIDRNLPCLLMGETGTGKTTLVHELANDNHAELIRINLNGQTSTDEFLGKWLIKDGSTEWADGALVTAMRRGTWIVIDEINSALPEILFALHSLLDDSRAIMLSEKDGEIVKPHDKFRLFATMNPSAEYAGTKELNKAFLSRFPIVVEFNYPSKEIEKEILKAHTGEIDAEFMAVFAEELRLMKNAGKIFYSCSTRDLIQWALLTDKLGLHTAFKVAILNKTGEDMQAVKQKYIDTTNYMGWVTKPLVLGNSLQEFYQKIGTRIAELNDKERLVDEKEKALQNRKKQIIDELVEFQAVKKAGKRK